MTSGAGDPVIPDKPPHSKVAFIAALQYEAGILQRSGISADRVFVSGPGRQAAASASRQALQTGASGLVSFGVAGGLDARAGSGSLVLADRVLDSEVEYITSESWRRRLVSALAGHLPVVEGCLYTVDTTVTTPAAKRELAARTGAVAVDMESAAIAGVADEAACPFIVVRAIADAVNDTLPENVDRLVSADGRTRYSGLVPFLWSPRQLRSLIQLGRSSGRARLALQQAAAVCHEMAA